jgi:hypothetical protein
VTINNLNLALAAPDVWAAEADVWAAEVATCARTSAFELENSAWAISDCLSDALGA